MEPPMMPGAPPPGMPGPPPAAMGGTGPAMAPGAQAGAAASATQDLKLGVAALQRAVGGLPMGTDIHTAVLKALTDISKHIDVSQDQQPPIQQLIELARQVQTAPPQAALMGRMFPPQGGGAPPMAA